MCENSLVRNPTTPNNQNEMTWLTHDNQAGSYNPMIPNGQIIRDQKQCSILCIWTNQLDLSFSWKVSSRILTLKSQTNIRFWDWPSAKACCWEEQPWGDSLLTIVRKFECKLYVIILSTIKHNFCYTNFVRLPSCLWNLAKIFLTVVFWDRFW